MKGQYTYLLTILINDSNLSGSNLLIDTDAIALG